MGTVHLAWLESGEVRGHTVRLPAREAYGYARHLKRFYRRNFGLASAWVTLRDRVVVA